MYLIWSKILYIMLNIAQKLRKSCNNKCDKTILHNLDDYDKNKPLVIIFDILVFGFDFLKLLKSQILW